MDSAEIMMLRANGDYRALWLDLLSRLPPCRVCGRPSTHILRLYPQHVPKYLCSRNGCHDVMARDNADDQEVIDGWRPAPWIDHVLAAEMSSDAIPARGGR